MLPYETERHARSLFRSLSVGSLAKKEMYLSDVFTDSLICTALRLARDFDSVAARQAGAPALDQRQIVKRLTFEQLIQEWQRQMAKQWEKRERGRVLNRFRRYIFPTLGNRQATAVSAPQILAAIRGVEDVGFLPLAHLILKEINRAYRFAIAAGYATNNPAADLSGALYSWKPRRRLTILVPSRVGDLVRAIRRYEGPTTAKYMLRLMPLVFTRPGELRKAEWSEVDFRRREWRIPAQRMKAKRPHTVPLSRQALQLFRQVYRTTKKGRYVFASPRSADGVLSDGHFKAMLRLIGFQGEMTPSGFRSMAATFLSEQGWNPEAIERQLSHADPRSMPRTYNYAEYLQERRQMMQGWADYLDRLQHRLNGRSRTRRPLTLAEQGVR